jgi:Bifunctional DNA primase/polymerase, N-terminal/Protein of unknown function (DUF3987)
VNGSVSHLEAALAYAARDLAVFPLAPRRKKPPLTARGLLDATSDGEQIREWWAETPEANIGLRTDGLLVVDADVRRGPDGLSGVERWEALVADHGGSEQTRTQRTGSGGVQVFFRDDERRFRNTTGKLGDGIDTRATGGYAVVPPSRHPSGGTYRWTSEVPCAPVPEWLAALLAPPPAAPVGLLRPLPPGVGETPYGRAALLGLEEEMCNAREGMRNQTLVALAFRLGRLSAAGELDAQDAERVLVAAAVAAGLSEREAERTFASGFRAGLDAGPALRRPLTHAREGAAMQNAASPTISAYAVNAVNAVGLPWNGDTALTAYTAFRPTMGERAFCGPAGDVLALWHGRTEHDPPALLVQLLVIVGCLLGRSPRLDVGAQTHRANLDALIIGRTSTGRKGESLAAAERIAERVEGETWPERLISGLGSGEALIEAVRDPRFGTNEEGEPIVKDEGVADKRKLVLAPEFARVLRVAHRENSILSTTLREAWDGRPLQNAVRGSPLIATGHHISVIGHITAHELRARLDMGEVANGFLNRYLLVYSDCDTAISRPTRPDEAALAEVAHRIRLALERARRLGSVTLDEEALAHWDGVYADLRRDRGGLVGDLCARAAPIALRLALLYAVLDGSATITPAHIDAALTIVRYAEASARHVFGDALGDPVADRILDALRANPAGLTREQIRGGVLQRNTPAEQIDRALELLRRTGRAAAAPEKTGGRDAARWRAAEHGPPTDRQHAADAPSRLSAANDYDALIARAALERETHA